MCIACELGFLSMIDALEAERRALMEKDGLAGEIGFRCEAAGEPVRAELPGEALRTADEPHRE
jgi:hypothetical protein